MLKSTFDPARELQIFLRRSRTGDKNFVFTSSGSPYVLAGKHFELVIKPFSHSTTNTIRLTVGDGLTIGGTSGNELAVHFTITQTNIKPKDYYWEFTDLDSNKTWITGIATVHDGEFDGVEDDTVDLTINLSGGDVNLSITPGGGTSGGGGTWGSIIGTLSAQTDLQAALDAKISKTNTGNDVTDPTNPQDVATKSYADNLLGAVVEDAINDGVTTKAPSENAVYDALLLKEAKYATFNTQTNDYTLVLADASKRVELNKATANAVTVPPNSSVAFPVGTEVAILQYGAGTTSITAGIGVTLRLSGGANLTSGQSAAILSGQSGMAFLSKRATDEWYLNLGGAEEIGNDQFLYITNW